MRILHLADLTIDRSFAERGLPPTLGALLRADLRADLGTIVKFARERAVDAITIAGNLYVQELATPETGKFLAGLLARLAPRPVLVAPGARDGYSDHSLYALTAWPANVHIFRSPALVPFTPNESFEVWGGTYPGEAPRTRPSGAGVRTTRLLLLPHDPNDASGAQLARLAAAVGAAGVLTGGARYLLPARVPLDAAGTTPWIAAPGASLPAPSGERRSPSAEDSASGARQSLACIVTLDDAEVHFEALPLSSAPAVTVEVSADGCSNAAQLAARIDAASENAQRKHGGRVLLRVAITGTPVVPISRPALEQSITSQGRHLIERAPHIAYDLDALSDEMTVRGTLARHVLERMTRVGEDAHPNLLAGAKLALQALDGIRGMPDGID